MIFLIYRVILANQVWLYNCSQWWFWPIRFDVTIVSYVNNCNVKTDWLEQPNQPMKLLYTIGWGLLPWSWGRKYIQRTGRGWRAGRGSRTCSPGPSWTTAGSPSQTRTRYSSCAVGSSGEQQTENIICTMIEDQLRHLLDTRHDMCCLQLRWATNWNKRVYYMICTLLKIAVISYLVWFGLSWV